MKRQATIEKVLKEIEIKAAEESIPILGPTKGEFLGALVRRFKPQRVLEIGTAIGYSAILIAINLPPGAQLETLEINPKNVERAIHYLLKSSLKDKVSIIAGDALKLIPTLSGPYDFVFLDAKKSDYCSYFKMLEEKITPGGVVIADNVKVFASSMRSYLNEVRNSPLFESETVDFGPDAMEVSVKLKT